MSKKSAKCRYCEAGSVPKESGEHWIVKSIFPARIDIRKCANPPTPVSSENQGE